MSYRCADGYCIQKLHLFACMGPAAVRQVAPETSGGAVVGLVDCAMSNGVTVPTTAMGCLQSGGRLADAGRATSPAPPPPAAPADIPPETPPAPPVAASAEPQSREGGVTSVSPDGTDACAPYSPGTIDRVRCGWVTGPERDRYVPTVGRSAGLKAQMDCIPVRDDEARYRACLAKPL
jgi:hypothetical protein